MKLYISQLIDKRACRDQVDLFRSRFGESVDVTPELCASVAAEFDFAWATRCLLSVSALAEYKRVTAPAWAEYERVRATAWAEYERVRATALAEYERVEASALAEYQRVEASAWAEYQRVEASALAEYERVEATAFANAYNTMGGVQS